MTQSERRLFLIKELLAEQPRFQDIEIPENEREQKRLLRSLFNIRTPLPVSPKFLEVQNAYWQAETAQKGVTRLEDLKPIRKGLYLWQGDITTLSCDGIVNAANSRMLGCFCPCHGCIDNAIHTFAGVELRLACDRLMKQQGHEEPTGDAKLTPAFNLPAKWVLHTVGPIVPGRVTPAHREKLASCYRSCLKLAMENGLHSIAFCCISTGEFHFPNREAAEIAVRTVKAYQEQTHGKIEVIFNVFKESDYHLYRELLGRE